MWLGHLLLGCCVATSAVAAQRPALMPDASQAVIDGRVAVGVWPTRDGDIVGPEGFTVHLADDERLERELVFPAGHWFQPARGRYKVWIEGRTGSVEDGSEGGRWWMAPFFNVLSYSGSPFHGRGIAAQTEVVPAGRVAVDDRVEWTESRSVRLLHLDATTERGLLTRGSMRAITSDRAHDPVLMPDGQVVGLLYDREQGGYVAVSRPVEVGGSQIAAVHPRAQRGVSDVLVVLHRPRPVELAEDDDLALSLSPAGSDGGGSAAQPPDVMISAWEWVYAIWYDVEWRTARLQATSEEVFLEPVEIVPRPGDVETYRGELRLRPHLDVRLDLPPALKPDAARVEVTQAADGLEVARQEIPLASEAVTRISGLPARELRVSLILDGDPIWKTRETVDLRDGGGREVVFRPSPIVLSGRVRYGDDPVPARVRLATVNERGLDTDRIWAQAVADDEGQYELTLYAPGCYPLFADVPGADIPEYRVHFPPCIRADTNLDIEIPASTARVRVVDGATGGPIPGAAVTYDVTFIGRDGEAAGGRSDQVVTGEDGWAQLPPVRPGRLDVRAEKSGYLPPSEPVLGEVLADRTTEVVVALDPVGDSVPLTLRLADGRPAAGAEVRAQVTSWNELPLWQGTADDAGRIEVPERVRGAWILVRHPKAGGWIQGWNPTAGEEEQWVLPRPAGPTRFRTEAPDGDPVPWVSVAMRYPNGWVAGRSLAWLTGVAVASSDRQGVWTVHGLPATELSILAGSPDIMALALRGLLEGSGTRITPPWSDETIAVPALR